MPLAISTLPAVLPVFPLTGVLLLPGNWLPLHVFEPRYRNMVEDALAGDGLIGMIQPRIPHEDNHPHPGAEHGAPELYPVGCAGRIEESRRLAGGRWAIVLHGVCRFAVQDELELLRGYRRVRASWDPFAADLGDPAEVALGDEFFTALAHLGEANGVSFEIEKLRALPAVAVVNGLAMALPFGPAEKQALLEVDGEARRDALAALLVMGLDLRLTATETPNQAPN